jgi:Toxin SymE, type I toxin-antitoxin system
MNEHKLTISELPAPGGAVSAPRLDLAGYWLQDAGFPVGARVEVEVVELGRLVVTRQDLEGPLPNLLPLVWVPVERLAAIEEAGAGAAQVVHG